MTPRKRKTLGIALCLGAAAVLGGGWLVALTAAELSTDNAYVRGEVTAIAPKVAGHITVVEIEDNRPVRAGEVLFRIDDRDFRARLAQAASNLEAAQARLSSVDAEMQLQQTLIRQAEAQRQGNLAEMNLAAKALDRRRQLVELGFVSSAQLDESDAAQTRAQAGVSVAAASVLAQRQRVALLGTQRIAALAAVDHARALRHLAQIDLDNTVVRAPVAGIVGNRQARVGRLVTPSVPLLDIVPHKQLWVVANFKETQLADVRPGQAARITVDGLPDDVFDAVVDSFAPASGSTFSMLPSDNATGNFVRVVQRVPVKLRFVGQPLPPKLAPGLSARVHILRADRS